jgi:hypothetical protein
MKNQTSVKIQSNGQRKHDIQWQERPLPPLVSVPAVIRIVPVCSGQLGAVCMPTAQGRCEMITV